MDPVEDVISADSFHLSQRLDNTVTLRSSNIDICRFLAANLWTGADMENANSRLKGSRTATPIAQTP